MPPYFRIILGCLAIGGAGFTIRALWTGVVYGRNWTPYSRDAQPGMFAFLTSAISSASSSACGSRPAIPWRIFSRRSASAACFATSKRGLDRANG